MIRKGGDRHLPAENPAAHFAAYLTLAVLMLVWVGTASAQYSGFLIPNRGQSAYPAQANVFSQDFQDITEALRGNGVLTGMQVVQHSPTGMQVDVGSGTFQWQAVTFAGCSVTLTLAQADTINPRFDIISVPSSTAACPITGTGSTPIVTTGTPSGTPVPPTIPQTGGFNNIVLAVVYIPARTTVVVQNQIIDKRAFVATVGGGGGGGGGGTPGPPNGAVQFNNAGIFGGSTAPLHVKAFGTSRAAIQAAIDAAPNGSIIQFDCVTYTLDGTTLTNVASGTQKDLIFQGCTSAPIGFSAPFSPGTSPGPNFGTVLQGLGSESIFTITFNSGAIQHGVLFRDLNMRLGTGGKGITLTTGATVGAGLTVERTAINGGASAIVGNTVRGVTLTANAFTNQTGNAVSLVGFNCDDGGINLSKNNFLGAPGTRAIYLEHIAAAVIEGNFTLYYQTALEVNMDTCTTGPGPTQFTIYGNQLETAGSGHPGHPILINAGSYSGGAITIGSNQLGQFGDGDIIRMLANNGQIIFGVTITGNTMGTLNAGGYGCVNLVNVLGATVANNTCDLGSHADAFIFKGTGAAMYGMVVSENTAINPVAGVVGYQGSGYTLISHYNEGSATPTNFAALPAVRDGSEVWCADCKTTSPCTGSGSGALAQRRGSTWQCVAAGIGPGAIADKQIVVGTGTGLTGFTDFTWNDSLQRFSAGSNLASVTGTVGGITALMAEGPITLDGTANPVAFSTLLNVKTISLVNNTGHILAAAGTSGSFSESDSVAFLGVDTGVANTSTANALAAAAFQTSFVTALRSAMVAVESSQIDTSTNAAMLGTALGLITGSSNAVLLGGAGGSVTNADNAVSINSGVVATDNTTAVGGTRFDVTYLGGAGVQCLQADNNGTIQASGAACGGGGLAIPATQIVVGTGASVASFTDFTWDDTNKLLLADDGSGVFTAGAQRATIMSSNAGAVGATADMVAIIASANAQNNALANGFIAGVTGGISPALIDNTVVYSAMVGGCCHSIDTGSGYSAIAGGDTNIITNGATYVFMGGGSTNTLDGASYAATVGGSSNTITQGDYVGILGGSGNVIDHASYSAIAGGSQVQILATNFGSGYSGMLGGSQNTIDGDSYSAIVGGSTNTINLTATPASRDYNFIGGGTGNTITDSQESAIVGGTSASITDSVDTTVIGQAVITGAELVFSIGAGNTVGAGGVVQDLLFGFGLTDTSGATGGSNTLIGSSISLVAGTTDFLLGLGITNTIGDSNFLAGLGITNNSGDSNLIVATDTGNTGSSNDLFGAGLSNAGNGNVLIGKNLTATHTGTMLVGIGVTSTANTALQLGVSATPEVTITAGSIALTGAVASGSATGKRVLCIDNTTKVIYISATGTDCSN